jgi:hypothetical protein
MPSVYDTLCRWTVRTRTCFSEPQPSGAVTRAEKLIYRLRRWPFLTTSYKTAGVYRVLSIMSSRPVNRHWLLAHAGLPEAQVDQLLARLVRQQAVEVIDAAKFTAQDQGSQP